MTMSLLDSFPHKLKSAYAPQLFQNLSHLTSPKLLINLYGFFVSYEPNTYLRREAPISYEIIQTGPKYFSFYILSILIP